MHGLSGISIKLAKFNMIIPYGRQDINHDDIDAVNEVLRSDFLTQGPVVPEFEKAVADYCSAEHAVAVNSATSALHIACLALELGPGDYMWTSATTFVASANCGLYCGAKVDFVDIDPRTYTISVEHLEEKLIGAKKSGKLPKIVIPVHLCGQSCDMVRIFELSQQYGFKIIEDAAHAIGGKYKGKPIGNCRYSDITVFSFHPVKIITTGEGGMGLTNDSVLADRMQQYRSHGITSDASQMLHRPQSEIWNYQQIRLGYNYRMTDIAAALGLSQITRLDSFVEKRHQIAQRYNEALSGLMLQLPFQHPDNYSSYHLYPVRIKSGYSSSTQREVYDALQSSGINVNLHYIPVYRHPYFESMGFRKGHCPEAECYHEEALSIPVFPTLRDEDQKKVISLLHQMLS